MNTDTNLNHQDRFHIKELQREVSNIKDHLKGLHFFDQELINKILALELKVDYLMSRVSSNPVNPLTQDSADKSD